MKYVVDDCLTNFKFWCGAKRNADSLSYTELDQLDIELKNYFSSENLPTETEINDLFWFEFEFVCSLIGLELDKEGDIIRNL